LGRALIKAIPPKLTALSGSIVSRTNRTFASGRPGNYWLCCSAHRRWRGLYQLCPNNHTYRVRFKGMLQRNHHRTLGLDSSERRGLYQLCPDNHTYRVRFKGMLQRNRHRTLGLDSSEVSWGTTGWGALREGDRHEVPSDLFWLLKIGASLFSVIKNSERCIDRMWWSKKKLKINRLQN